MAERNKELKNSIKLILTLLFVYVVLFEFILPVNKFLPKPSILFESIFYIINDYNLFISISVSFTIVIVAFIVAYIGVYVRAPYLFKWLTTYKESFTTLNLFRYFLIIIVIILVHQWFEEKLYWEFIFAAVFALTLSIKKLFDKIKNVKAEYIIVGKNLGLTDMEISEDIHWKYLQPVLIGYYEKLNISLWGIILVFEFIGDTNGLGHAFHKALLYKDLNAIILFSIILFVLVWATTFIIKVIRRKYFSWAN
jgi:ABC-type nitrate/sulfonate/bicarbonate transport system permease component